MLSNFPYNSKLGDFPLFQTNEIFYCTERILWTFLKIFMNFTHRWHVKRKFVPWVLAGTSPSMHTRSVLTLISSLSGVAAGEALASRHAQISRSNMELCSVGHRRQVDIFKRFWKHICQWGKCSILHSMRKLTCSGKTTPKCDIYKVYI